MAVTNTSAVSIGIDGWYPTFAGNGRGVTMVLAGEVANRFVLSADRAQREAVIRPAPVVMLGPGESWSVAIFLQRFIPAVGPGTHRIRYSADLLLTRIGSGRPESATGSGEFQLVVLDAPPHAVADALAGYWDRFDSAGMDYWRRVASQEAICVTDSPLAVPYYRRILHRGLSGDAFIEDLAKFKGNRDAEELLVEIAKGRPGALVALRILQRWGYVLTPTDFERISNFSDFAMSDAALRYAEAIGNPLYAQSVEKKLDNPNQTIASEARRVLAKLNSAAKQ
jgi:hypothetical protein